MLTSRENLDGSRPLQISIAIKTCRRESGVDYLRQTIANLKRGGVMASAHLSGDIHIVVGLDGISLHQNAQRAIEIAAADPNADYCLVLEDDIDVCANFLESVANWLLDHASDECRTRLQIYGSRMYVFGANYSQITAAVARGETFWDYPIGAFYGAQALAWSRSDAEQLAQWLGPDPHYNEVRNHGHDLLLQRWGASIGLTHFLASAPSFVQHIGGQSGIGNRFFQFQSWPGRDWEYRRLSNRITDAPVAVEAGAI